VNDAVSEAARCCKPTALELLSYTYQDTRFLTNFQDIWTSCYNYSTLTLVFMQEISATIHGNVQAVGFRAYTKKQADDLGLVGWVRNVGDASVECVAQGTEEKLETFVGHLESGPYFAEVENAVIDWHDRPQDACSQFEIIHD